MEIRCGWVKNEVKRGRVVGPGLMGGVGLMWVGWVRG